MKYIAYALRASRGKWTLKNIMVNLGCLAGIVVIAYALISTIAVPCGAGEADWNLWAVIGRAAGGIG